MSEESLAPLAGGRVPTDELQPPNPEKSANSLESSYEAMGTKQSLFHVVDALLKRPGQILYEVVQGRSVPISLMLLGITIVCLAGIGLMMASYSGGAQFAVVPLKIVLGMLLSAVICLPSLYILLCLSGGRQSFPQVCSILLKAMALMGVLFVGFLPVAWIF
jgi:hypothetical protein